MLDRRSQNIIFICKNKHPFYNITVREALKKYMAETCYGDINEASVYNDRILLDIIREVVLDVMSNLNEGHHRKFIFDYFEAAKRYVDLDAWLIALELLQVRDKNESTGAYEFINGFSQIEILKEKYPESAPDEVMYPEYVKAIEYRDTFDYNEVVSYEDERWRIVGFPTVMTVKLDQEAEDIYKVKEEVSIFDIKKII